MLGLFSSAPSKSELKRNYKYLEKLIRKGREVGYREELNIGSQCTMYRKITQHAPNGYKPKHLGYEESIVDGNAVIKPCEFEGFQIHISFSKVPFLEKYRDGLFKKRNYPLYWSFLTVYNTEFKYNFNDIVYKDHNGSPLLQKWNCRVYDCGDVYVINHGASEMKENIMVVIKKAKK